MPIPITLHLKCPKCNYTTIKQISDSNPLLDKICPKCNSIMEEVESKDMFSNIVDTIKNIFK
jgi:peptide subunit release factor 1 (eRF1)